MTKNKYKSRFSYIFIYLTVVPYFLGIGIAIVNNPSVVRVLLEPMAHVVLFSFLFVYAGIVGMMLQRLYLIIIEESRIRGANTIGLRRWIALSEIYRCKSLNLLGLRFIRAFVNDHFFTIWIPMFMSQKDKERLCLDIEAKAGEGHSIARIMRERFV